MSFESPLLALATILLAGLVGGELASRIRLPRVTGWIGTGIILGNLGLSGLEQSNLRRFSSFTDFVLGFIAFSVGATLHFVSLRNAGRRLGLLILSEALLLPCIVAPVLYYIGGLDLQTSMILAAIAIAGAPGTTMLVVKEAEAKGVLSRTLIAAVGLIDMVAVAVFAFATSVIRSGDISLENFGPAMQATGVEFGLALSIGLGCAVLVLSLSRRLIGPSFWGPMMVAVILGAWGLGKSFGASSILACTFAGIAVSNLHHSTARTAEEYLQPFGGVLFAGFYTLAGMRLNFNLVVAAAGMVTLYFAARLVAKSVSAYLAMAAAGATQKIKRFLGIALLPHGGVAVGLIFSIQEDAQLSHLGDTIATVGLAALAINQLVGPSATRMALHQAGEAAKDRPRLLDFLSEQRIVLGLRGNDKRTIIEQLADRLYATTPMPLPKGEFVERVMTREAEASTAFGQGFMVPHAQVDEGEQVRGVLGLSADGLNIDTPDGRKVHAVVLLATPENDRQRHLEILAAFARTITKDPKLREQLYISSSAAHAYDILHAESAEQLNYFLDEMIQEFGRSENGPKASQSSTSLRKS